MRHVDVLEEQDSLRGPFLGSLFVHLGVFGAIAAATVVPFLNKAEPWGDPNAMGGSAVSISAVKSIPMPGRTGPIQRVANDTKSQVPAPPKPEPKRHVAKEDPTAIALKSKRATEREKPRVTPAGSAAQKQEYASNQLTSREGAAASSPIFAPAPGSGGVGVGTGAPFGSMFGAYASLVRDRVAQRWRTDQVDSRLNTLPAAIVTFEIMRNGQVKNVRVIQSSGNRALDYSAERAVFEASPFQPLPVQYSGNTATVEFLFKLQR